MLTNLKFALRSMRLNPGFTLTAILTIGLGIGINSAVFTLVNGVLLKPLPYADADRLVRFREFKEQNIVGISYPDYEDWRRRSHSFERMAVYNPGNVFTLKVHDAAALVPAAATRWNLFSMLGVQPILGRSFLASEDTGNGADVVIVSYDAWVKYFDKDPKVIGKQVPVTGGAVTIVGVLPESFGLGNAALWYPMGEVRNPLQLDRGNHMNFAAIGRLRTGVTIEQARGEMKAIASSLAQEFPAADKNVRASVTPLLDATVGSVRSTLWMLFGAVGFVLLIACSNVANLLLTRTMNRQRELSVRVALGASRGQVMRLMLTESLMLTIAGAALGVGLATWSLELVKLQPRVLPRPVAIDPAVLAYTIVVTLLAALAFGLIPVWRAGRVNLTDSLKQGGRGTAGSRGARQTRHFLVAAQVALSIALVAGAGLMIRSIYTLQHQDLGFQPDNLVGARMFLTFHKDKGKEEWTRQALAQLEALRALPGVKSAAAMWPLPEGEFGSAWLPMVNFEDHPRDPGAEPRVEAAMVSPDYFKTMGIPLLQGRGFNPDDLRDTSTAVIVSDRFAKSSYPDGKALGKRIRMVGATSAKDWKEIVGVVGNTHGTGLSGPVLPEVYWPYGFFGSLDTAFVVRTTVNPETMFRPVRGAAAKVDSGAVLYRLDTMENILAKTIADRRFTQVLLTVFAALALVLAGIGIYGVVAISVAQRTQEIGIRMALGAKSPDVFRLVLSQILTPAGIGLAIGLAAAGALTPLLANQVYGVRPRDPLTFVAAGVLLGGIAVVASLLPARRASRVDPMIALRQD